MKSLLFRTASNLMLPLLLLFSIFIMLRGHYLPGGGFVGGLIGSIAFLIHTFAYGIKETRAMIRLNPGYLMPIGLGFCLLAGFLPWFIDLPFLTGIWNPNPLIFLGYVGTALIFDIGVYLVVMGAVLTIIFSIIDSM